MDLPTVFLHAENNKDVVVCLNGELAELMVLTAPQTSQNVITADAKGM